MQWILALRLFFLEWESDSESEKEDDMTSEEEELASALAKESPKQKRKNMGDITNLVMAGARFGASEREVCAIVNAVREDDGVDLKENPHLVMIKCTQQRKRF